jgi:hypothetical protein
MPLRLGLAFQENPAYMAGFRHGIQRGAIGWFFVFESESDDVIGQSRRHETE